MEKSNLSMFLRFSLSSFLLSSFLILCSFKEGHALVRRKEVPESNYHTIQISPLLPASACKITTKGSYKGASLKVVHKHGPCYRPKAEAPTVGQILSRDQARVNSVQSRVAFNSGKKALQDSASTLPAKSAASLGSGNYLITVGLGTPPKKLSLIFDTGSDLTWTQCQPCAGTCYNQQDPILDPSKSSSYANISCSSPQCSALTSATGNSPRCAGSTCVYGIQYGDQSFSAGYFAKERLTLTPTDVFDNFLFGCGQNNQGLFGQTDGLIGLARDQLSIVSQTAQKYGNYFSYCLPTRSSAGHLTFGKSGVSKNLKFTPFDSSQGTSFYFVDLNAIIVGGRKLPISGTVFSTAGTIIDSGTVITRLPPGAYTPFRDAFRQLMKKYPVAQPLSILDTCYDFSNYTTITMPTISFLFNGAMVDISKNGVFYVAKSSQVCLAFAGNNDASDVGIFGNVQQQTLEVVYDVAGGKLGFGPGGCA